MPLCSSASLCPRTAVDLLTLIDKYLIFQPNELSNATVVSMRTRIITALVAIAVVLPAVIVGDWAIFGIVSLACGLGVLEIIRCAKMKYSKALYIIGFVLALAIVAISKSIDSSTLVSLKTKLSN